MHAVETVKDERDISIGKHQKDNSDLKKEKS